jgi:hypothetical protein
VLKGLDTLDRAVEQFPEAFAIGVETARRRAGGA